MAVRTRIEFDSSSKEDEVVVTADDIIFKPPEKVAYVEPPVLKHKYNIMPDASEADDLILLESIRTNGFDEKNFPIIATDSHTILDGYRRWTACQKLGITPRFKYVDFTDEQALDFVLRTAARRNMTPEMCAAVAVLATEMYADIKALVAKEAKEIQVRKPVENSVPTLVGNRKKEHKNEAKAKVAAKLNTTPKLLAAAEKLLVENPTKLVEVAEGKTTLRKANAEIKAKVAKKPKDDCKAESGGITLNVKVNDELHLQLKAAAKAYGDTLQDYISNVLSQAIENIGGGVADMKIYKKELNKLKNNSKI